MDKTKRRRRKRATGWSYSAGAWGKNRIRAFERGTHGIYLDYWEPTGELAHPYKRVRIALGHSDRTLAEAKVEELAVAFRTCTPDSRRKPTLGELFDIYEAEVTPTKGRSQQGHDRRIFEMCRRFFGNDRDPATLSRRDWDRYIIARRSGQIRPLSVRQVRVVGERIIGADCIQLQAVFNWAVTAGDAQGGVLLDRNPFKGFPIPQEANPRRPIIGAEYYAKLLEVAPQVDYRLALALILTYETGHRIGAIRMLRWGDIDLARRAIQWRAEHDKIGFEHLTPLRDQALRPLQEAWDARVVSGEAQDDWVFPSPLDPTKPCDQWIMRKWWIRAEKCAKLVHPPKVGWHSLRRLFASEMKHTNLKDLAYMGGWKDPNTILRCYQTPDEQSQRAALAARKPLTAADVGGTNAAFATLATTRPI